jgi:hypothetical protein
MIGGHECEDGSLGCFVSMVQKAGPADINNIEVGKMEFHIAYKYNKFNFLN